MDVKTLLSIYNKPWLVEPQAAGQMLDFFERTVASGGMWDYKEANGAESKGDDDTLKFFASSVAVARGYNIKGLESARIAVIPVSGPLMKADYCGSPGTARMAAMVKQAAAAPNIETIILAIDSPGGTVDGTQAFADAVANAGKRTIAVVDGMMCSAAYWIGSQCNEVYASSRLDFVGSIGTMCTLVDRSEAQKASGTVVREYYADASADKNKMITDAVKGDGKALIAEMLNPINDVFLATVKKARGAKMSSDENVLTGKTYTADKAQEHGLIDGVKSMDEVIGESLKAKSATTTTLQIKNQNKIMILADFKAQHPGTYAEAVAEGVAKEQTRVQSWMVFNDVDPEAVAAGIEGGKDLDPVTMAKFGKKQMGLNTLADAKADNPVAITVDQTTSKEVSAEDKAAAEFLANCKKDLNLA